MSGNIISLEALHSQAAYSSKKSIIDYNPATGADEENDKLNSLIDEYRKENERCSVKIQELQDKLHQTSSKFYKEEPRYQRNLNNQLNPSMFYSMGSNKNGMSAQSLKTSFATAEDPNKMILTFKSDMQPQKLMSNYSSSSKDIQSLKNLPEKDNNGYFSGKKIENP